MPRIYLDNAATSWPKPEAVYRAMDDWQRRLGASYGRGTSAAAEETRSLIDQARRRVAQLLGETDPRRVVFTNGGTESLNAALFGLLRNGDHVVATVCEHNAVLRPLGWLVSGEAPLRVEATYVGVDAEGRIDPDELLAAVRPETRLVVMVHASNVTGAVQPVGEVAQRVRPRGVRLVVDAAQSLGRWPIDVTELGADVVAAPGHKGLLGPLGVGVLWIGGGVESELTPYRWGGAASGGDLDRLPDTMPDRLEAGSLNVPAICGLSAGVEHVLEMGVERIRAAVFAARERLAAGLETIPGVRIYGPRDPRRQAGVVSFSVEGYDPQVFAAALADAAGGESRAGLHCAPKLHEALGVRAAGGLVRFSPAPGTPAEHLDAAIDAVRLLAQPLT